MLSPVEILMKLHIVWHNGVGQELMVIVLLYGWTEKNGEVNYENLFNKRTMYSKYSAVI